MPKVGQGEGQQGQGPRRPSIRAEAEEAQGEPQVCLRIQVPQAMGRQDYTHGLPHADGEVRSEVNQSSNEHHAKGPWPKKKRPLGSGMWVEYGDRSKDFSQLDPKDRFGHVFFGFPDGAETSKVRHLKIFREAAAVVRISPVTMEDRDHRAKWTTSINEALWQGTGALPAERAANFVTIF